MCSVQGLTKMSQIPIADLVNVPNTAGLLDAARQTPIHAATCGTSYCPKRSARYARTCPRTRQSSTSPADPGRCGDSGATVRQYLA